MTSPLQSATLWGELYLRQLGGSNWLVAAKQNRLDMMNKIGTIAGGEKVNRQKVKVVLVVELE